jgi:hypothetical protein
MIDELTKTPINQAIGHQGYGTTMRQFSLFPNFLLRLKLFFAKLAMDGKITSKILLMLVDNNKKSLCLSEEMMICCQSGNMK